MAKKNLPVYLGVLVVISTLLFTFCKTVAISNKTSAPASLLMEESSPLATWLGEYSFAEYAPPGQNMFYSLTIYCEGDDFFGQLSIDGFQTMKRLLVKVSGDAGSIDLKFLRYLPDNISGIYKEGDILLTLEKTGGKLITTWGKIKPLLLENQAPGEYFRVDEAAGNAPPAPAR